MYGKKTNSTINGNNYYRIRKVVGHKANGEKILKNFYGESKLVNVKSMHIQKFYNTLSKNGYSYSQINTLNSFLKAFFNWCIDNDYILKNPCSKVNLKGNKTDIINNKRKNVEILSEKEIATLKSFLKGSDFELLFLLDLATGLRQGELLALDWEHIDLENKTAKIDRSVKEVYIYDDENTKHIETIFQTPKTLTSFITIFIPDVFK